jgi:hypothetical protein
MMDRLLGYALAAGCVALLVLIVVATVRLG